MFSIANHLWRENTQITKFKNYFSLKLNQVFQILHDKTPNYKEDKNKGGNQVDNFAGHSSLLCYSLR